MFFAEDARVTVHDGALWLGREDVVERIIPWGDSAGAWWSRDGAHWVGFVPSLCVRALEEAIAELSACHALPAHLQERLDAARFLVSAWPADVLRVVRAFASGHWALLQLVNHCGERALQLLFSNPALGALVATSRPDDADRLLSWRRRRIAAAFGFPDSEASVRLLRKIPAEWVAACVAELRVTLCVDSEAAAVLRRVPVINPFVLAVAGHPLQRDCCAHRVLVELGALGPRAPSSRIVLGLDALQGQQDLAALAPRRLEECVFPPPPVPDSDVLHALRSLDDLQTEGRVMRHCLGGEEHVLGVLGGSVYFYRCLAPERATVCLQCAGGSWGIGEVRGKCNAIVTPATIAMIQDWLGRDHAVPEQLAFGFACRAYEY